MKKLYSTVRYKTRQKQIQNRALRRRKKKRKCGVSHFSVAQQKRKSLQNPIYKILKAPEDFRLLDNTHKVVCFLNDTRKGSKHCYYKGKEFLNLDLSSVRHLDYASCSALLAIIEGLMKAKISTHGNMPEDKESKKLLIDSGFLNYMTDSEGKKFDLKSESDNIFLELNQGPLSESKLRYISDISKKITTYLNSNEPYNKPLYNLFLEICGNSIEHAKVHNQQWLLGVVYKSDQVVVTLTDIGVGILSSLYMTVPQKILANFKKDETILYNAFKKKYGSSTQETNRNKGLPSVKDKSDKGVMKELKVVTNNVFLNFDNTKKSYSWSKKNTFAGTVYQWCLTRDSLHKIEN